jgi:type II secretory ATPase GspE/PulE/Tfp pilus assembly ATPase PilB-like protein
MAKKTTTLDLLKSVDIFSSLKDEDLKSLNEIAASEEHAAGKVVVKQGDPSENFHIVDSGLYEVYLWDDLMKVERPLGDLGPGEIFGEMGVLTGETRSAYVRCRNKGNTIQFKKAPFFAFLEKNPKVAIGISKTLVHRLLAANKARRLPFENIGRFEVTQGVLSLLPLQVILRHKVLPLSLKGTQVVVGLVDPSDLVGRNVSSEFLNKYEIEWVCVSQPDYEHFRDNTLYELLAESISDEDQEQRELQWVSGNVVAASDVSSPVSLKLNEIIVQAIENSASDLHFEPGPKGVAVRARIDGRLLEHAAPIELPEYKHMVSRVKVLSDLDITETRLPQEAAIRAKLGDRHVDLRVSTLPTPRGESVVIRLLDPEQRMLDLRNLVVNESIAELMEQLFFHPSGLLLVTGPTGSGKTTTLYAGLQMRLHQNPTDKLITAEDPVEYEFDNATQVQVRESVGLTFAKIMRSMLRQDPDVVLVGEMRDKTSMDIALEAALTGHFVMSSLHTNSAFETIQRLRQRGIEPYLIASALRGIISQRLVSKICAACAQEAKPTADELSKLRSAGLLAKNETITVWAAEGCAQCRMTGAKGRIGLYEVLVISPEVREAIENDESLTQLERSAPASAYLPMQRYARFVLEKGLASVSDVLRVFPSNDKTVTSALAPKKKKAVAKK